MEVIPEGAVVSLRNVAAEGWLAPADDGEVRASARSEQDEVAQLRVSWVQDPSGRWITFTHAPSGRRLELAPTPDGRLLTLRAVVRPPGWRTSDWEKFRLEDGEYLYGKGAGGYLTHVAPSRAWWNLLGERPSPPYLGAAERREEGSRFALHFVSVPPEIERLPLPHGSIVALRDETTGMYLRPAAPGERPTWTLARSVDDPHTRFRLHKSLDARGELLALECVEGGNPVMAYNVDGRKIIAPAASSGAWHGDSGERLRRDGDGALFCVEHAGYFTSHAGAEGDEREVTLGPDVPARALRVVSVEAERIVEHDRHETAHTLRGVWASPSLRATREASERTRRLEVKDAAAPAETAPEARSP